VAALPRDLTGVPTLVLLVPAGVSPAVRRRGLASLGLRRPDCAARMRLSVSVMADGPAAATATADTQAAARRGGATVAYRTSGPPARLTDRGAESIT